MNYKNGSDKSCGMIDLGGGVGLCEDCSDNKRDAINKRCAEYNKYLMDNYKEDIDKTIEEGKRIRIITFK
jgi:hypothetical protein